MDLGIALTLTQTYKELIEILESKTSGQKLPLLSSECPGWICYAEKTQGEILFPHMSKVKSPQQMNGVLLRQVLEWSEVFHIAVAPCYDKKLEALHAKLISEKEEVQTRREEVDLVLTSTQLLQLLQKHQFKIELTEQSEEEQEEKGEALLVRALRSAHGPKSLGAVFGSTSNGYAEFIAHCLATHYSEKKEALQFQAVRKKNEDLKTTLVSGPHHSELEIAKSYSFRNLTNVVRKVKHSKCGYAFIEMMACPGGCLNGGGQIKPQSNSDAKTLLSQIESSLRSQKPDKPDWSFSQLNPALEYVRGFLAKEGKTRGFKTGFIETDKAQGSSPFRLDW